MLRFASLVLTPVQICFTNLLLSVFFLKFILQLYVYGVYRHFQQYFSYIVVVGGQRKPEENHRPVSSH